MSSFLGSSETGLSVEDDRPTLEDWLISLELTHYMDNFKANKYEEMDRISAIWDDELSSILEIDKIGHRKRILLSLAGRQGMPHRFGKVKESNLKVFNQYKWKNLGTT